MSERKDEKWLDNRLQQAINGSMSAFDAEAWKQKHRDEYQALLARGKQAVNRRDTRNRWGKPHPMGLRMVLGSWVGRLAVAAAIVAAVGILLLALPGRHIRAPGEGSPAEMVTVMSLEAAYRQGGTEALDRQFDKALKLLGPRTTGMSLKELLGS